MDSEAVLQATESYPESSTRVVSGEFVISQFTVVCHFTAAKASGATQLGLILANYSKTHRNI